MSTVWSIWLGIFYGRYTYFMSIRQPAKIENYHHQKKIISNYNISGEDCAYFQCWYWVDNCPPGMLCCVRNVIVIVHNWDNLIYFSYFVVIFIIIIFVEPFNLGESSP